MVCDDGSPTTMSNVSTWYQRLVTPEYYDALSLCHSPTRTVASPLRHSNEMLPARTSNIFVHVPFRSSQAHSQASMDSIDAGRRKPVPDSHVNPIRPMDSRQLRPRDRSNLHVPGFQRSISIADLQAGKRMSSLESDRLGLRRAPQSIFDLRNHARAQHETVLGRHSPQRQLEEIQNQCPTSQPHINVDPTEKKLRRKVHYKSYQDLHILSMYQENGSLLSLNSIRQPQSATIESSSDASSSAASSRQSSPQPRTPVQEDSADHQSWEDAREMNQDKLRRANARQVHVIEQSQDSDEYETEIVSTLTSKLFSIRLIHSQMQATVLIGPGKPRLIHVHRPMQSSNTPNLRKNDSTSTSSGPYTPVGNEHKLSVSAPPQTSGSSGTRLSDISSATTVQSPIPKERISRLSVKTNFAMHTPSPSPVRRPSRSSDDTVFSLDGHAAQRVPDPFSSPSSRASSTGNTSIPDESPLKLSRTLRKSMRGAKNMDNTHESSLAAAITSTNKALDALASGSFDLKSPILLSFWETNKSSESAVIADPKLISRLARVFPHSSQPSLSTLAAWLIVDGYYIHLLSRSAEVYTTPISSATNYQDTRSRNSPRNLRSTHTPPLITISQATSPTHQNTRTTSISSPIYTTNIPSKAQSILGIQVPQQQQSPTRTPTRSLTQTNAAGHKHRPFTTTTPGPKHPNTPPSNPTSIRDKAKIVHASIQTIGRKLIRDLVLGSPATATADTSPTAARDSPGQGTSKSRSIKDAVRHGRQRSHAVIRNGSVGVGGSTTTLTTNEANVDDTEKLVNALWESCRCIASSR